MHTYSQIYSLVIAWVQLAASTTPALLIKGFDLKSLQVCQAGTFHDTTFTGKREREKEKREKRKTQ